MQIIETPWTVIKYVDHGLKTHITPSFLTNHIITDLSSRYPKHELEDITGTKEAYFDAGGMVSRNRTWQKIDVGNGCFVNIPTIDFEYFFDLFDTYSVRSFEDGTKYYKIFNAFSYVIVLTQEQFDLMISEMKNMSEKVKVAADEELGEFKRILDQVNAGEVRCISHRDADKEARLKGIPSGKCN
jgi:hypothetical protein